MNSKEMGSKIKMRRKWRRETVETVARRASIEPDRLTAIERGSRAELYELVNLSGALGWTSGHLVEVSGRQE